MVGQNIGSFRIVGLLAQGGMGLVYEAVHAQIRRRAVIKLLRHEHLQGPNKENWVRRFFNEANCASALVHPGVVQIYDFGHHDGQPYIVMEYLEGETLRARLSRGPMNGLVLRIGRQIADAMAAAHDKGIIHRDLKPDNIYLVTDPDVPGRVRAKVLDFGIAKKPLSSGPNDFFTQYETREGVYTGTPHYMSPEQCHGGLEISAGTDVYSLGIILYQMVSGHPPFEANATGALLAMQQYEVPPSLEGQPGVSPELATLLVEMLQKKAEDRPSMRQVAERLEQLGQLSQAQQNGTMAGLASVVAHVAAAPSAPPQPQRRWSLAVAMVLVAVGALAVGRLARWYAGPSDGGLHYVSADLGAPSPSDLATSLAAVRPADAKAADQGAEVHLAPERVRDERGAASAVRPKPERPTKKKKDTEDWSQDPGLPSELMPDGGAR